MPASAYNRVADNWRPLFAIAQVAGGDWPRLALEAFNSLTAQNALNPQLSTINQQATLLAAIRQIFAQLGTDRIFSKQLVESLRALPDRPYSQPSTPNHQLTAARLARLLRGFGVTSRTMRIGDHLAKGYALADFADPFSRFLTNSPS